MVAPALWRQPSRPAHLVSMTVTDITSKLPIGQPVQDALPVPLPRGARKTELVSTLTDPREPEEPCGDAVLHLREEGGANIIQVTDSSGRLHRTDGPALVRITPGGRVTKQWWVEGRRIDDAGGPTVMLALFGRNYELLDDEVKVVNDYLPAGFYVGTDGALHGPEGARGALTTDDSDRIMVFAEDGDPVQEVIEHIHRRQVRQQFAARRGGQRAA